MTSRHLARSQAAEDAGLVETPVLIATVEGPRAVRGYHAPAVPGLAIGYYDREWRVSHRASGRRLASAETLAEAAAIVRAVATLIDWTQDATTIDATLDRAQLAAVVAPSALAVPAARTQAPPPAGQG